MTTPEYQRSTWGDVVALAPDAGRIAVAVSDAARSAGKVAAALPLIALALIAIAAVALVVLA